MYMYQTTLKHSDLKQQYFFSSCICILKELNSFSLLYLKSTVVAQKLEAGVIWKSHSLKWLVVAGHLQHLSWGFLLQHYSWLCHVASSSSQHGNTTNWVSREKKISKKRASLTAFKSHTISLSSYPIQWRSQSPA